MYLGSSPKGSRFWCALPEGTPEGTQMPRWPFQEQDGMQMSGWPLATRRPMCLGLPPRPGVE